METDKKRIYKPLTKIEDYEIKRILSCGTYEELVLLPLRVGEYGTDWIKSQNICLKLMNNENEAIRANAALGLAYIARTQGNLDKRLVKPYLLRELQRNEKYRWRIIDSITDINIFLKWHMAEKSIEKYREDYWRS